MTVFNWVERTRVRDITENFDSLSTSTEDQVSFFYIPKSNEKDKWRHAVTGTVIMITSHRRHRHRHRRRRGGRQELFEEGRCFTLISVLIRPRLDLDET